MPDAWRWLSLNVESELHLQETQQPIGICDTEFVAWIKTEPDRLAKRLESHRRLRQAYADRIAELDAELALLSSG